MFEFIKEMLVILLHGIVSAPSHTKCKSLGNEIGNCVTQTTLITLGCLIQGGVLNNWGVGKV